MNVAELLRKQAAERRDAPALIGGRGGRTRVVTFAELEERSARIAAYFRERGLRKGDAALILQPMSVELYVILLGLFRIGAVAIFLDPSAGRDHLEASCAMLSPQALIATPKAHFLRLTSAAVRRIPRKFSTSSWLPGARSLKRANHVAPLSEIERCQPRDTALVTFTSGSTGAPKGVVRSHGALTAQHHALEPALRHRANHVDLITLPIFVLSSLAAGATSVIPDADLRRPGAAAPDPLLQQIAEHETTRLIASPAVFERLLDRSDRVAAAFARVAEIFTGGAPVFPDLVAGLARAAPGARVTAVYGSTEAEPIAQVSHSQISEGDVAMMASGQGLLAGTLVPHVRLAILPDQFGRPIGPFSRAAFEAECLPPGQAGEIAVTGGHVLKSYLKGQGNEEAKFAVGTEVWHRTEDAGYLDDHGRLWLLGRCSARISDRHGTLYPFSVECAARLRLGIRRSACVSHDSERILVIEAANGEVDAAALGAALARTRIAAVYFVDRIPMDSRHNSKVEYPALLRKLQTEPYRQVNLLSQEG